MTPDRDNVPFNLDKNNTLKLGRNSVPYSNEVYKFILWCFSIFHFMFRIVLSKKIASNHRVDHICMAYFR